MPVRTWTVTEIEVLIVEHLPAMYTLCNRMFRQAPDVEDAVHAAVQQVLVSLPEYRGEGPVRHWLLKVTLNAARNHRRELSRREAREPAREQAMLEIGGTASERFEAEQREMEERLRAAIAGLPDDIEAPLTLYYYHRLTQQEIAGIIGVSQKTVHDRIERALEMLKSMMRPAAGVAGAAAWMGLLQNGVVEAAPAALVNSVKINIASSLAGMSASAIGGAAAGQVIAATGGIIMNTKLIVGAMAIAALSFFGGGYALNGGRTAAPETAPSSDGDGGRQELEGRVKSSQARSSEVEERLQTAQAAWDAERRRLEEANAALNRDVEASRDTLAALQQQVRDLQAATAGKNTPEQADWDAWQEKLQPIFGVLDQLSKGEGDQFTLGIQLVSELGKLSAEDYRKLHEFDRENTDAGIRTEIAVVLTNAMVFAKDRTQEFREEYMTSFLDRLKNREFSDDWSENALAQISYAQPPYVDAYKSIVEPLNDTLRAQYMDYALAQMAATHSESRRQGAALMLARMPDDKATAELKRLLEFDGNSLQLRRIALWGMTERATPETVTFVRQVMERQEDAAWKEEMLKYVQYMEQKLAQAPVDPR